jgi:hypothetical protein
MRGGGGDAGKVGWVRRRRGRRWRRLDNGTFEHGEVGIAALALLERTRHVCDAPRGAVTVAAGRNEATKRHDGVVTANITVMRTLQRQSTVGAVRVVPDGDCRRCRCAARDSCFALCSCSAASFGFVSSFGLSVRLFGRFGLLLGRGFATFFCFPPIQRQMSAEARSARTLFSPRTAHVTRSL